MAKLQTLVGIQHRLGYTFQDPALLKRALTHASARTGTSTGFDNERLEFLGDRVLGLSIAELLLEAFPDAPEGELAKRLNRLVRRETCAYVGRALDLGAALRLGSSETSSGGRHKDTILADACEAVLGAAFLDGGFLTARDLVRRLWSGLIDETSDAPADPKSALQEWAQGQGLALPTYREIERSGPDHAPSFTTEVHVEGALPALGMGRNKRMAEQRAATAMLTREGVWQAVDDVEENDLPGSDDT